ncbi:hypothetical protein Tco_1020314 [Tanacetum coccineum]|uniref:Uncharacterized protein n=1 Tax=Tanacetum coccineum TaxID=301880 RepID=A0ABQ5G034_9ASTR
MEPDISNMTLNEYLMYQGRHKDLERSCTSLKSVAPKRNRILVYPDFDEEDKEYCNLPPLLPCFQTTRPYATFNSVYHNSHSEVNIDNMTLEVYVRYELAMSSMKSEIQVPTQGAENIGKMEHKILNRCNDITDYEDCDQEDGELPDLPTFFATNEFTSIYEQVEENIDVNTTQELEEVHVRDVEMDKDDTIDYSNPEETLQWSPAKDPFLVCMEFNDQSSFVLHTIPSSISNKVKKEFKIPHRFRLQRDEIRGYLNSCYVVRSLEILTRIHSSTWDTVWFKRLFAYAKCNRDAYESELGKHFKSGLVGYHVIDDDVLELWMLLMEADLKHGLEHVVSSSS